MHPRPIETHRSDPFQGGRHIDERFRIFCIESRNFDIRGPCRFGGAPKSDRRRPAPQVCCSPPLQSACGFASYRDSGKGRSIGKSDLSSDLHPASLAPTDRETAHGRFRHPIAFAKLSRRGAGPSGLFGRVNNAGAEKVIVPLSTGGVSPARWRLRRILTLFSCVTGKSV